MIEYYYSMLHSDTQDEQKDVGVVLQRLYNGGYLFILKTLVEKSIDDKCFVYLVKEKNKKQKVKHIQFGTHFHKNVDN